MEALWRSRNGRTSHQVLQEYYVTVTRKLRPGLPASIARDDVRALIEWDPVTTDAALLERAWSIEQRVRVSFSDALIVAAAAASGASTLLTEHLKEGAEIEGVLIVDPFRTPPSAETIHDR